MAIKISIIGKDSESEKFWKKELSESVRSVLSGVTVESVVEKGSGYDSLGQLVFIDGEHPDFKHAIGRVDRKGRALFVLLKEGAGIPDALYTGLVEDVLVHPFRSVEILGKVRHYQQVMMWDEVVTLNASFSELLNELKEDLSLAERIQKSRHPVRFEDVKGFKVAQRHLSGLRSGGDYFDLAESSSGSQLSFFLTDSSSYGLSNAVLTVLMQLAFSLSKEEVRSSSETVKKIHQQLGAALKPLDRLSICYGAISRKDYKLRYVNLGSIGLFHSRRGQAFQLLNSQGEGITRETRPSQLHGIEDGTVQLEPGDRIVVLSDGFVNAVGAPSEVLKLLDGYREKESLDSVNELVYRIKSEFKEPDDLPEQDCTALVFDVDEKILRLAG